MKKRGVGRWRLSGGGGGVRGDGFGPSPPRSNRNPFSPEASVAREQLRVCAGGTKEKLLVFALVLDVNILMKMENDKT